MIRDNQHGRLPILVIMGLILALVAAGGAFTFTRVAHKGKGEKKAQEKPAEVSTWKLEEFIVNLADRGDAPHYLKIDIVLEVQGKLKSEGEGGGNPLDAKVRDTVITVLTRKHFSELLSEAGKTKLKSDLKKSLNKVLNGELKVVNVYFTSFAMQ